MGYESLSKIITSRIRLKILEMFFLNPGKPFYLREMSRATEEDYQNVSREIYRLVDAGLLVSRKKGKTKYFSLNKKFSYLWELKALIISQSEFGKGLSRRIGSEGVIWAGLFLASEERMELRVLYTEEYRSELEELEDYVKKSGTNVSIDFLKTGKFQSRFSSKERAYEWFHSSGMYELRRNREIFRYIDIIGSMTDRRIERRRYQPFRPFLEMGED